MKYKAFISYRHLEPDMTAAKRLHTLIENYNIPKNVKISKSITRMGRIFRDQEELPTSTNLSDDIFDALKNSEWLIVICTPNLLQSRWCMKEIDTFIELGKRDHILAVLVSGTPEESFPKQLKYMEKSGEIIEVEPLAANLVAKSTAESMKKLKVEKLRLIAPMLGVAFDDLKQREKERKFKRRLAVSSGIIAGLLAFSAYAVVQNNRIHKERTAALISQSEYLADASESALEKGDRMLALMLGLEALPVRFDQPEKPVVESAVEALRNAVVYGAGQDCYTKVTDLEYVSYDSDIDSNSSTIFVFGNKKPYLQTFDLFTGKETSESEQLVLSEKPDKVFMDPRNLPVLFYGTTALAVTRNGSLMDMNVPEDMKYLHKVSFNEDSSQRVFYGNNQAYLWNAHNYKGLLTLPEGTIITDVSPQMYAAVSPWESDIGVYQLKVGYMDNDTGPQSHILREFKIPYDQLGIQSLHRFNCLSFDVSQDGDLLAYCGGTSSRGTHLLFWSGNTGDFLHFLSSADLLGSTDDSVFKTIEFEPSGHRLAITSGTGKCLIYDPDHDSLTWMETGAYKIRTAHFNSDGTKLLCSTDKEGILFDAITGELSDVLPAGFEIRDAVYAETDVYGNSTYDMAILLKGPSGLTIYKSGVNDTDVLYNAAVVLDQFNNEARVDRFVFDPEKRRLFAPDSSEIRVFDVQTGKQIASLEDCGFSILFDSKGKMLTYNPVNSDTPSSIHIYEAETLSLITTLSPSYEHWADGSRAGDHEFCYQNIQLSDDEKILLLTTDEYGSRKSEHRFRTAVFAYDAETDEELWCVSVRDYFDLQNRYFEETKNWDGPIEMSAGFQGDTVTILYRYGDYGVVVEHRNARSGELLNRYAIQDARTKMTVLNSKTISETVETVSYQYSQMVYALRSEKGQKNEKILYLVDLKDGTLLNTIELDSPCAVKWISESKLCLFPSNDASENCYVWNTSDNTLTKILYSEIKENFQTVSYPRAEAIGHDHYLLWKDASVEEIAEAARALLKGRELNEYQRRAYHIDE